MTAIQDHGVAGSGYGSVYVDSLIWGHAGWKAASGPITYYLADASDAAAGPHPDADSFSDWSATETASFLKILDNYASVCGLTFAASPTLAAANLVEWKVSSDFDGGDLLGEHDVPEAGAGHNGHADQVWGYFNYQATASWSQIQQGGDGYYTLIHELGHAMGLAHPHDGGDQSDATIFPGVADEDDTGRFGMNQGVYTVMSYNADYDGTPRTGLLYGEAGTLGPLDIAALQALYGANMSYHAGNDVYTMPIANRTGTFWSCIWDAGGIDTIDDSASTRAALIDLRAATLQGISAGGYVSSNQAIRGGFTIAHGVVIENAIGGSGNDSLIGNDAGNLLDGGVGADTMAGGVGNDTYIRDDVGDVIQERNTGIDLVETKHSYSLGGQGLENITLTGTYAVNGTGNGLANHMLGNGAANILNGAGVADTMEGGAGDDTYVVDSAQDVVVAPGGGVDLVKSAVDFTLAGQALENLTLMGTAARATGNSYANVIVGNAAANVIDGMTGADTLTGGDGADVFVFDTALGAANIDTIKDFSVVDDVIRLGHAAFQGLSAGPLSSSAFFVGAAAHDATDRIVYDSATGKLFFDDDGNGAHAAQQFAKLAAGLALTSADFTVV